MANRNEQQGPDQEVSTYGRQGGYQPQGNNPYPTPSQYQPAQPTRGQGAQGQGMRGYGGDENQRLQSHGYGSQPSGHGSPQGYAQGREGFNEFSEHAQGWQTERGWDTPQQGRQQFGQSGFGSQQRSESAGQHQGYRSESLGYGAAGSQHRGGQYQSADDSTGMRGASDFGMGSYTASGRGATSFRGRGPKNYSRSDERIREDLCERLTQDDDIDASEIEVKAAQGVVTLEGTVEQRWMKHRAEDLADAITGVRQVENRIRVQGNEAATRTQHGQVGASNKTGSSTATSAGAGSGSGSIAPH